MKKKIFFIFLTLILIGCSDNTLYFHVENANDIVPLTTITIEVNESKIIDTAFEYSNIAHNYHNFEYSTKMKKVNLKIYDSFCGAVFEDSIDVETQNQIFVQLVNEENSPSERCDFVVSFSKDYGRIR